MKYIILYFFCSSGICNKHPHIAGLRGQRHLENSPRLKSTQQEVQAVESQKGSASAAILGLGCPSKVATDIFRKFQKLTSASLSAQLGDHGNYSLRPSSHLDTF